MLTFWPMMWRNWARGIAAGALLALPVSARADEKTNDKQMCIAAAEQGQSQRDDGQYRAARDSFVKCAAEVCPRVIVQSCTKWLRELNESAPTIVLTAKDEQGNDLTDVSVTFDGTPFATTLTGNPMEADPGEHVVRFARAGSVPVEEKLLLSAGERARVVSVKLVPIPVKADAGVPEAPEAPGPAPLPPSESALSGHHVAAAVFGLGAVAAAVTGVVFVLQSNHKKDEATTLRATLAPDGCTGVSSSTCNSLNDDVQAEHDDMNIADGLFIGAGALVVGAVATWVLWPRAAASSPDTTGWIAPIRGGATVQVAGTFQ